MIFEQKLFDLKDSNDFENFAVELFHYQVKENLVYKDYTQHLNIQTNKINSINQLPFLPIEFFKTHKIITGKCKASKIFLSSGTSFSQKSRHYIVSEDLYKTMSVKCFEYFFGPLSAYCILALLPSYLQQTDSSLVFMVDNFIMKCGDKKSGFYINNYKELFNLLENKLNTGKKVILFGATYALLDFVEYYTQPLNNLSDTENLIIMETGGMKGMRKEITRNELHAILCDAFKVKQVYSEYGMTELLSQAYLKSEAVFRCPVWMKVLIRDINDPFSFSKLNHTGGINIIDLANIHSCSFIATQDIGKVYQDGSFEVSGRFDTSDIRGCNLLTSLG